MNKLRYVLIALTAVLVVTSFSFAGEGDDGEKHHKMAIKIAGDVGGLETMDIDNLDVGETRQFFTDSGKEVTITREESGYSLNVDGKDIAIHSSGNHHGASVIALDGEDGHHVKVISKTMSFSSDGEEGDNVFILSGDAAEGEHGEHSFVWVSDDETVSGHDFLIQKKKGVLGHVLESEALNGLDEDTRQRIIDAIKAGEKASGPHMFHGTQTFVIESEDTDEEEVH